MLERRSRQGEAVEARTEPNGVSNFRREPGGGLFVMLSGFLAGNPEEAGVSG